MEAFMPGTLQNGDHATLMAHMSNGARLVSASGQTLPLREINLTSEVVGGIARTILRQHFTNEYDIPLELLYQFPLPADGAISAYQIVAGPRRIVGRDSEEEHEQPDGIHVVLLSADAVPVAMKGGW